MTDCSNSVPSILSGVIVFIDDDLNKEGTAADRLYRDLVEHNLPVVPYSELPGILTVQHFHSVSFVLLDWNTSENYKKDNLYFIEEVRKKTLAPIVIFTAYSKETVLREIRETIEDEAMLKHWTDTDYKNLIILNKDEVKDFNELKQKILANYKKQPSLYTLKEWESKLRIAKQKMISFFHGISVNWASEYFRSATEDKTDPGYVLQELLFSNLKARQDCLELEQEIFLTGTKEKGEELLNLTESQAKEVEDNELNSLIQATLFLNYDDKYNPEMLFSGDVFEDNDGYYWVNIRPQCDCIPRGKELGDVELFLIRAEHCPYGKFNSKTRYQEYLKKKASPLTCHIYPFNEGVLTFEFKTFRVQKYKELSNQKRVGRLLQPVLPYLIQEFGLFLQRPGLPPYPKYISTNKKG